MSMDVAEIAGRLTKAQRDDLTINWDRFCDADRADIRTQDADYPSELEAAGFVILDEVSADDLETPFAWELGIEPGGSVYRLTSLGLAVRANLLNQDTYHD